MTDSATPSPQRVYRAACPGCGAPVSFRSAQSTHAVCGYCQSTVARQGEVLSRIGKLAELFDDHSPLQIGATGRHRGVGFVLVGRIQYRGSQGVWTEWAALQDDGAPATLSEDNGSHVYSRPTQAPTAWPAPERLRLGATTAVAGQTYAVALNDTVTLLAAQGELAHLPPVGQAFAWVELRSQAADAPGRVLTLDYAPTLTGQPPLASLGEAVALDELQMSGLRDGTVRDETGRQFGCPSCGAPVTVGLASTQRLTCGACRSLIDLSQGIGAEIVAATQDEPVEPLIPLGSLGQLQGKTWQVVGFQHRLGTEPGDADEQFGWSEYLLFNAQRGFQFLVDSTEGWSLVKPTTGAPKLAADQRTARYLGTTYRLQYAYHAETTYVAGEFYWPVMRGQRSFNRDFASGQSLLNQEEAGSEITWSVGSRLNADTVAQMFKLDPTRLASSGPAWRDARPTSELGWTGKLMVVVLVIVLILLIQWLDRQDCDPATQNCATSSSGGSRSSGGSWGGYSSGGSHK